MNHPINHGIGLFVCEISEFSEEIGLYRTDIIKNNLLFWEEKFAELESYLKATHFKSIAIFGASEICTLFLTFSSLSNQNITAVIDDTKEIGFIKHNLPVFESNWLFDNNVDLLLLAVNKKYHESIIKKFTNLNFQIHPVY